MRSFWHVPLTAILSLSVAGANLNVNTNIGTFQGFSTSGGLLEAWLGLPYAQPPVGSLRFKAPVTTQTRVAGVRNATAFGHACPQPGSSFGTGVTQAEDCLVLNVYRPAGTSANAKLPVLFWIHGGAYTSGAASEFDPTRIVNRSVAIGQPIIFVSTNYRLNTFGFLASASVPVQDLNAGLLDQHASLSFVQANIAKFGGDPTKVTIWGQSAGAGSVEALLLFPPKVQSFRAAIADSSTGPFKSSPPPAKYDAPGKPFATILGQTGCAAGSGAVACLQKVPFANLSSITNTLIGNTLNGQLWQPTIAPGSLAPQRASAVIQSGKFLKVPYLAGTNLNEGNTFSGSTFGIPHTAAQEDGLFDNFVEHLILDSTTLTSDVLNTFHTLYPANDTSLGAPFNTGDSLFDRSAAWYGDEMFLAPRRFFFDNAASSMQMWAYHFREFLPGDPVVDGVSHASELGLLFGSNLAASELTFANTYLDAYLNFVNKLNPGSFWPQFDPSNPQVLQLKNGNITLIPDTFNLDKTTFINTAEVLNEFEK